MEGFSTFDNFLAVDPATGQGVAGVVAQVFDLKTGVPVATFDGNGDPRPVVTNIKGFADSFYTADTVAQVVVKVGNVSLPLTAQEMIGAGVEAAQAAQAAAESLAVGVVRSVNNTPPDTLGNVTVATGGGGTSNVGIDTDGRFYFELGQNAAALLVDEDGRPYFNPL